MLQWVWSKRIDDEGNDPRRVILIMTYRSWARKTLMTKEENDKVTYSSSFASQSRDFEVLICDEAHRLKERSTVSFKAVSLIAASRVLLLSATPCLNDPKDYLALAEINWTCRHQILDQEERDFLLELEKKGYGQFANTVKSFCQDENTHRTLRSLASKPEIVKALIQTRPRSRTGRLGSIISAQLLSCADQLAPQSSE
ncbi:putative dna repair helicase protein [Colletotrichum scovillei]|uniref:SNF2-like protein n=1 Tax=Colletotrichum scovillei TaxID=1209932 RepID=A0A9P7RE37_9PEZI|nr:putative dna repair helicase protein [Colletotrichum scovillei]KAF4775762.1 putative dna repair helicase protein [Colletotrichum scovillei]KAG7053959.1 putative SNF2-like protein [Colletotrichum scovillei]KAG7072255.1 putative SNF2-like protein [Colletotrichum scovillei]KAG7080466.1 putative SNF2-like protein [Colletotrichum scovillei]